MVKFLPVEPDEVPNLREGHRGRVSYPIIKSFLETGYEIAKLDRTGMQQSAQSLMACLRYYINAHNMPIKMFQRAGEIYLARTDLDDPEVETEPVPVTDEEVAKRKAARAEQQSSGGGSEKTSSERSRSGTSAGAASLCSSAATSGGIRSRKGRFWFACARLTLPHAP